MKSIPRSFIADNSIAASATVRAIGPAVSCLCEIGMIPRPLNNPTVGLIPTMPLFDDGDTIEPSVSVPTAAAHRPTATAAPEPLLEPDGFRSSACGLLVCPPRALQPLVDRGDRMLAHSLKFVLPKITAPAARSRATTAASCFGRGAPTNASDPAVVIIRSAVSMLSLIRTGIPCSKPRRRPARRSSSSPAAIASASGFTSITA